MLYTTSDHIHVAVNFKYGYNFFDNKFWKFIRCETKAEGTMKSFQSALY